MTDPVAVHEQARFTYLRSFPHSGGPTVLLIFLSKRYQGNQMIATVSDWTFEPPALRCLKGLIELFDYLDDVSYLAYRPEGYLRPVWQEWWVEEDLNLRPHAYQACALTN